MYDVLTALDKTRVPICSLDLLLPGRDNRVYGVVVKIHVPSRNFSSIVCAANISRRKIFARGALVRLDVLLVRPDTKHVLAVCRSLSAPGDLCSISPLACSFPFARVCGAGHFV